MTRPTSVWVAPILIETMRVAMKEDRPSCARLRRGAGFSHRGRGAPLSAPDAPTVNASVLYTPLSETVRKSCLCRRLGEGVASGRHQLRPAKIHGPSEKHLGLTRGELARERLKHGVRPTQARVRALADSQDQRRLSNATACHLVGSL